MNARQLSRMTTRFGATALLAMAATALLVPAAVHAQEATIAASQSSQYKERAAAGGKPAHRARHAAHRLQRQLDRVDATPEQRAAIEPLAREAAADLKAIGERRRALHRERMVVLADPVVDRAQLEALRVEQMALTDEASRRMTQAMADVADQLTPEQRVQWFTQMQRRGDRSRGEFRQRHGAQQHSMDRAALFGGRAAHHRSMM